MTPSQTFTQAFGQPSGTELVHGRPVRTYGRGRTCEIENCDTRLSVYNPGPVCALHRLGY
jgi:hypothetical protein